MNRLLLTLLFLVPVTCGLAQNRIGTGTVDEVYQTNCATCHGVNLEGGLGSSLTDEEWNNGYSDEAIARSISEGYPDLGMVPWKITFSDEQIRSLVIYVREQGQLAGAGDPFGRELPRRADQGRRRGVTETNRSILRFVLDRKTIRSMLLNKF